MNYAHMLITVSHNVQNGRVVDDELVTKKVLRSDDTVYVFDTIAQKFETIKLINISLYDHRLVIDGMNHYVLRSLWKPEPN